MRTAAFAGLVALCAPHAVSLAPPTLPTWRLPTLPSVPSSGALEAELLSAIDARARPSEIAARFEALERAAPAPRTLLVDPARAAVLDGPWRLRWTIAQRTGGDGFDDDDELVATVNASGVKVEADGANVVQVRGEAGCGVPYGSTRTRKLGFVYRR